MTQEGIIMVINYRGTTNIANRHIKEWLTTTTPTLDHKCLIDITQYLIPQYKHHHSVIKLCWTNSTLSSVNNTYSIGLLCPAN